MRLFVYRKSRFGAESGRTYRCANHESLCIRRFCGAAAGDRAHSETSLQILGLFLGNGYYERRFNSKSIWKHEPLCIRRFCGAAAGGRAQRDVVLESPSAEGRCRRRPDLKHGAWEPCNAAKRFCGAGRGRQGAKRCRFGIPICFFVRGRCRRRFHQSDTQNHATPRSGFAGQSREKRESHRAV